MPTLRALCLAAAVLAAVAASSCGTGSPCDASTCSGCCTASGMCQSGSTDSYCGLRGQLCGTCGVGQTCSPTTSSCVAGAGGSGGGGSGGSGPAPTGASCTDPIPLDLSKGRVTVDGAANVQAAGNDATGSCGGATGADRVYSFTLLASATINATLFNTTETTAALYLRRECMGQELACKLGPKGVSNAIRNLALPAGTYFLWVDGVSDRYTVEVNTGIGDTCSQPEPLEFIGDQADVKAAVEFAQYDYSSANCVSSVSVKDTVYSFTTTESRRLVASVVGTPSQPAWLALRSSCGTQNAEVTCGADKYGATEVAVPNLPAGTWYLIAGGVDYDVRVRLGEPASAGTAERCTSTVSRLAVLNGQTTAISGAVGGAFDRPYFPGCGRDTTEGDSVHQLVLTQAGAVELRAVPMGGSKVDLGILVAGADAFCNVAAPQRCVDANTSTSESTKFSSLAAGTYWVWVFGPPGAGYMLETRFDPQQ